MADLKYTETNAADDSAGRVFGLEGNLYLPVVGATALGVMIFAGVMFTGGRISVAAGGAAVPVVAALVLILGFRQGKPAGYDRDWLDQRLGGGDFTREAVSKSNTRSHAGAPEGWFAQGMIVFGNPEQGGLVAKGFRLEPPDLRGASVERLNAFQDQVRGMLSLIGPGRRLQVQWWADSDYREALLAYHDATQAVKDEAVRKVRNERFARYWPRMQAGDLRREHLAVFVSIEVEARPGMLAGRQGLEEHYGTVLQELAGQFEEFAATLRTIFGAETPVRAMDDAEHCACVRRFLNPSLVRRGEQELAFDPAMSLQENCWLGEGVGQAGGGFYLDGHYHAVLALARWPQRTRPGIVTHLTGLPFLDYCITVIATPVGGRGEVMREEKAAERLRGEYAEKPRASLLVALRKKERKVEALAGGFTRPFRVTYLVRLWAPTPEALRVKVMAVQAAISAMEGAGYFECALAATAKKLFFASWPGWTHSSYGHRELYAEDAYLADLLPFSATFTGSLKGAEALYDGTQGNLVGVATEAGGSPQHAALLGMTGAGKSMFVEDLLMQTAGLFAHTLIVEEGLSYKRFTESMGETPIVIHPDAGVTINYLDTGGQPLTQLHLATAVSLLARMAGDVSSEGDLALRQAQLTQYLHRLYRETFVSWSQGNAAGAEEVKRLACAAHQWKSRMPAGAGALEAYLDLRERWVAGDEMVLEFVHGLSEERIATFSADPATQRQVAQVACAFYGREEFPVHRMLVKLLRSGRIAEHGKEEIDRLATLLGAWTADGQYGKLFDGPTTVSLQRRVAHFELGLIPEQATELKVAAGLLVSGMGRQHILALPRKERKRVLFEELGRFLDTPGGEKIVAESYEQLRKHNCWAMSIIQQYGRFKASRVRSAIMGNAKQFFFMRQNDRTDLVDLTRDLPLPESAAEAIQRYPLPEQLPEGRKFSSVCLFNPSAQPPQCGTLRHIQEEPCGPS